MRDVVHEFLQRKKYMVVLDDVRGERDVGLRDVFPRNGNGCIIVTTRVRSIAAACSCVHVHEMKPLSLEKSESLLCEKAFRGKACPHDLSVFFEKILLKCDGLPLAIDVIGSILGGNGGTPLEWLRFSQHFIDETGYPLGSSRHGFSLRRLSKTLSLSYHDLPCYLQHCFLYLSIVPPKGGGVLDSSETIRLWIAEGLVESERRRTLEEVAQDYLNELSNRSLLQVAEKDVDGSVLSFRIHNLVREYITTKLTENGMATICHGSGSEIWWPSGHKTRRLAVLKSVSILLSSEMNRLEHLRCMLVWRDVDIGLDLIKALLDKCRLLKVLDLGASPLEGGIPAGVFKLYHLKFLCLRDTKIDHIPKEIKYLENLETLDLGRCYVTELPREILNLRRLRHLLVHKRKTAYDVTFEHTMSFKAPSKIGSCLTRLQSLSCVEASEVGGVKMVREIGKLKELRKLEVAKLRSQDGEELCSSIAHLTFLRSLKIFGAEEEEQMDLDHPLFSSSSSCAAVLPWLKTLHLCGRIQRIPQWIQSLIRLTSLVLVWTKLNEDPLSRLEHLPNLATLWIHDACVETLTFRGDAFQRLKSLSLAGFKRLEGVAVEKGSMPCLESWQIWDCKSLVELPRGIEHLKRLQSIQLGNMPAEFVEKFAKERSSKGDDWKLPQVQFGL